MSGQYLLDTNTLIALTEIRHTHHRIAQQWFDQIDGQIWGISPLTEAGFIRITCNSRSYPNPHSIEEAIAILKAIRELPGFCYWEMRQSWVELTEPFAIRISGHQQVTDAFLLGLAIRRDGVLVTLDKGVRYMAGAEFSRNLLLLAN